MKLFISYSSEDRPWVIELSKALHDDLGYLAWYDHLTAAAAQWWQVIMENLETADCVIYVMTPNSLQSTYCQTEIDYALRLNKPILPIFLKECAYPQNLADREIQWLRLIENAALSWILLQIERSFSRILIDKERGKYQPQPADRPNVPRKHDPKESYRLAAQSAAQANFSLALELYQRVIDAGESPYRKGAQERHTEIELYAEIAHLCEQGLIRDARPLWRDYVSQFGDEYDPKALKAFLERVITRTLAPPKANPKIEAVERAAYAFKGERHRDWTPVSMAFDDLQIPDMPFCLVPVGSFEMGDDQYHNQKKHRQTITRPYWIAQTPVTNAQWRLAVKAGVVSEPQTQNALAWYQDATMADAPVVGISWFEALKFCQWLGVRLPTEREWEYAARGIENLFYPWGNRWNAVNAVFEGNSGRKPNAVTSHPQGRSWVNARHLSGNVWEWCSTIYHEETYPYPYREDDGREDLEAANVRRVLRGGSWFNIGGDLHAANRIGGLPTDQINDIGFRCARFSIRVV